MGSLSYQFQTMSEENKKINTATQSYIKSVLFKENLQKFLSSERVGNGNLYEITFLNEDKCRVTHNCRYKNGEMCYKWTLRICS